MYTSTKNCQQTDIYNFIDADVYVDNANKVLRIFIFYIALFYDSIRSIYFDYTCFSCWTCKK